MSYSINPPHEDRHLSYPEKALKALKNKFPLVKVNADGSHVFQGYRKSYQRIFPVAKAIKLGQIMVEYDGDNDLITVSTINVH